MANTATMTQTGVPLAEPDIGGSTGTWGGILNNDLVLAVLEVNAISAILGTAGTGSPPTGGTGLQGLVDGKLNLAGGVMTGRLTVFGEVPLWVDSGNTGAGLALDLALGDAFSFTVTGNCALTFSHIPSGQVVTGVLLRIINGAAHTFAFPVNTKWPGSVAPTLSNPGTDLVALLSFDGTTWYGFVVLNLA